MGLQNERKAGGGLANRKDDKGRKQLNRLDSVNLSSSPQSGLIYSENIGGLLNRSRLFQNLFYVDFFEGGERDQIADTGKTD